MTRLPNTIGLQLHIIFSKELGIKTVVRKKPIIKKICKIDNY